METSVQKKISAIDTVPLMQGGKPVDFVFKRMRDIHPGKKEKDHKPHRHAFYSIIWIMEGKGSHQVDFKTYPAESGTVFFISPEQVHHLNMDGEHNGAVLLFTCNFLEQYSAGTNWLRQSGFFFRCDDVAPLVLNEKSARPLQDIILEIEREFEQKQDGYLDLIGAELKIFLLHCQRQASQHAPVRTERHRSASALVKKFKDLLDEHYAQWHMVSNYASIMHITPNYLNEILQAETGRSAKDMILSRIMLEAKRHAIHSDISVKELAFVLGFEDPAHFSKLFKQIEQQGFTEFRSLIRKKYS
jgi:AraC family transcriptional regulator, transcriptional activator of pobA